MTPMNHKTNTPPALVADLDKIALDAANKVVEIFVEDTPDWHMKSKIQEAVSDAITLARSAAPAPTAWEQYADIVRIQRGEAESDRQDHYMRGLYNGIVMMCSNFDGISYPMMDAPAVEPSAEKVAQSDIDLVRAAVFKSPAVETQHAFDRILKAKGYEVGTPGSAEQASKVAMPDLDKLEVLARAAEQMFTGMHWYTRFQILDGISNDESAAFIGALDPNTVLNLIALARLAAPVSPPDGAMPEQTDECPHEFRKWDLKREDYDPATRKPRAAQPAEGSAQVARPSQITNTLDARMFLDAWHLKHFPTDRTFSRYIKGDTERNQLAGDFAWQLAKALEQLAAPERSDTPAPRDAVLEEAALICDRQAKDPECPERAAYCAEAIRALKGGK